MSVPLKLASFAVVLALAFGGAALAGGALAGDDGDEGEGSAPAGAEAGDRSAAHHGSEADSPAQEAAPQPEPLPGGLAAAAAGYRLELDRTRFEPDSAVSLNFRILDRDERPVSDGFELEHERRMHLIVVRRDTATFEHVHPELAADGTWQTELTLERAGAYRVFADFALEGERLSLGTDLFVAGEHRPRSFKRERRTDEAGGYEISLEGGELRAGREAELTFAVVHDGRPADVLEPYLGADGHLVALRQGDLAYLHVHPLEAGGQGHEAEADHDPHGAREVTFATTFPSAGRYRLFLDFKAEGVVRTASYTVEVSP